jgi:hypothetical protein
MRLEYVRPDRKRHERVSLGTSKYVIFYNQLIRIMGNIEWPQLGSESICSDPGIFGEAHPQALAAKFRLVGDVAGFNWNWTPLSNSLLSSLNFSDASTITPTTRR